MREIFLKKHEDRRIRAGHLWVFSNEVDADKTPLAGLEPGEDVSVMDSRGHPLGSATINPASLICARLHSRHCGMPLNHRLLLERLSAALVLRARMFGRPWYRLCHAEGDFLPGLVVDRFDRHLTVQIGTAAMERRRDDIVACLEETVRPDSIYFENDIRSRQLEGLPEDPVTIGDVPGQAVIPENGCHFAVSLRDGQKTGWFYDQRDNRRIFAQYADGASVLDICCYVGGFGVMAAAAGARSVTFVDSSLPALDLARENMHGNAPQCAAEFICSDVFATLQELRDAGRKFDLISLDPPALVKRKKDLARGLAAYRKLNDLALRLLADGGVIASSSCSQHLPADALLACLARAAARQDWSLRILHRGRQAPDHPAHCAMPETDYLKCYIAQKQQ